MITYKQCPIITVLASLVISRLCFQPKEGQNENGLAPSDTDSTQVGVFVYRKLEATYL